MYLTGNKIFAPFYCVIKVLYDADHASYLEDNNGLQIIVHIGVDTFKIQGMNKRHRKVGDKVKKGDLLITTNVNKLIKKTGNSATAIVFLSGERITLIKDKMNVDYLEEDIIKMEEV